MDLFLRDEKRFLRAEFRGRWNIEDFVRGVGKILAECRARKRRLLLIDFTPLESNSMTLGDRYRMGSEAAALSEAIRRLAAVVPPALLDHEKFGEQVAQNRGLNVRAFLEFQEAKKWLMRGDR